MRPAASPSSVDLSPETAAEAFAAVVVNVEAPGLRQPFTYRVPPYLTGEIAPGACVVVPFGTHQAIGYVIAVTERPPEQLEAVTIKDVFARATGDGATLPAAVLQTARWMAQTYLCDLAQCVRCVIPDAQAAHIVRRIALADGWEATLPEITTTSHRQVIVALSGFPGGATETELTAAVGGVKVTSPLQILRKRGLLTDRWSVEPPRIGARKVCLLYTSPSPRDS